MRIRNLEYAYPVCIYVFGFVFTCRFQVIYFILLFTLYSFLHCEQLFICSFCARISFSIPFLSSLCINLVSKQFDNHVSNCVLVPISNSQCYFYSNYRFLSVFPYRFDTSYGFRSPVSCSPPALCFVLCWSCIWDQKSYHCKMGEN